MSNFIIEEDVPLPGRPGPRTGKSKYPFAAMEVGQSFLVGSDVKPSTVRSAIGAFMKGYPQRRFAVRVVEGGTRVWRVADAAPKQPVEEDLDTDE